MSTYHHGNLRATLIEQGVELARREGPDGVVLREVARRAGVSHNAAYRHFADRDALLAEIATVGMQRLAEAMLADMDAVTETGPLPRATARLRACGRAYVHFAVAEPGLFTAAFAAITPAPDGAAPGPATESPGSPEPPTPTDCSPARSTSSRLPGRWVTAAARAPRCSAGRPCTVTPSCT